jgi:hypothetical protein
METWSKYPYQGFWLDKPSKWRISTCGVYHPGCIFFPRLIWRYLQGTRLGEEGQSRSQEPREKKEDGIKMALSHLPPCFLSSDTLFPTSIHI